MNASELLSLEEAAAYLGCQPRTLRKLIDRSRLRLRGRPVPDSTIQFFQRTGRGPSNSAARGWTPISRLALKGPRQHRL